MPPLSKFVQRKFEIHLEKKAIDAPSVFSTSVIACSAKSNGYGWEWDRIQKPHPNPGSLFESEASIQT